MKPGASGSEMVAAFESWQRIAVPLAGRATANWAAHEPPAGAASPFASGGLMAAGPPPRPPALGA